MFQRISPGSEDEWLQLRLKVLTATEMGAILGLNKWKSVREVIEGKEKVKFFENAYTWLGQQLEPVVVEAVNKSLDTDFELFDDKAFFVDYELGLGATPDAGNGDILLECKSTKPHNALRWAHWPPAYYLIQLYVQMICCERQTGMLAILSTNLTQKTEELNLPLSIFKIERDEEIDQIVTKEVKRFWQCQAENKLYRVDRKQSNMLECKLYCLIEKIK